MAEEEEVLCPLCLEALDITDRSFLPCQCGYQVCLWCWHNINEKLNGKCPACRAPYKQEQAVAVDPKVVAAAEAERLQKKAEKAAAKQQQHQLLQQKQLIQQAQKKKCTAATFDRSVLQNVRVMQRNLVYVIGLPPSIAKDDILRRKEHFGRFGRIVKVAVNRKQMHATNNSLSSYSAYVTFKRSQDACSAIQELNGINMEGRVIRATFGTTKYCSFFLRNITCNNPNCLYLHSLARDDDCFTKEDLAATDRLNPIYGHSDREALEEEELHQESMMAEMEEQHRQRQQQRRNDSLESSLQRRERDTFSSTEVASAQGVTISDSRPPPLQSQRHRQVPHIPVLPGLSALGLGKGSSGPFGWCSVQTADDAEVGKTAATISPPDSPRTLSRRKQQKEMQDTFRALLPNINVTFQSRSGPALEHDSAVDYNLFATRRHDSQSLFHYTSEYDDVEGRPSIRHRQPLQPRSRDRTVPGANSPFIRQTMH